jgi:tetratricopeptide (TPR) repeat protein
MLIVLEWQTSWIFGAYGIFFVLYGLIFRARLFFWLGNVNYAINKKEKAKEMFMRSINHGSRNPLTFLNYAILLMQGNEPNAAIEYADKALGMKCDEVMFRNAMLTKSSAYWHLNRRDKAIETLEELAGKYEYVNSHVSISLGFMYIAQGNFIKAKEIAIKTLEQHPESGAAWDNMGQIYLHEGDKAKAEEAFLKALSIKENLADSTFLLGKIYEEAGKTNLAKEYFLRAKGCTVTIMNTATAKEIDEKYEHYMRIEEDYDDYDDEDEEVNNETD